MGLKNLLSKQITVERGPIERSGPFR